VSIDEYILTMDIGPSLLVATSIDYIERAISGNHQHTVTASEPHLMKRAPDALLEKYLRKANKYEAQSEQAGSFQSHIDRAEKLANNQLKLAVWQSRNPHSAKILGDMYLDKLIRAALKIRAGQDVDGRLAQIIWMGFEEKVL
jgi:hypothetical protein